MLVVAGIRDLQFDAFFSMWFDQGAHDIRCEWGERGIEVLAPTVDAIIVVDVLCFSTCVDIGTVGGALIYPYRWRDDTAADFARDVGATLAGRRGSARISLSPPSLRHVTRGMKLVLPSPNGATLSCLTGKTPTFAACFRNAESVAAAARALGPRIGVIPCGERWPDGSLRPCLEDWLGAGAVIRHLSGSLSPESDAARAAFEQRARDLEPALRGCGSARELIEQGWEEDVIVAAQLGSSTAAPRLVDGAYQAVFTDGSDDASSRM
jgi:2-phosphosulfolactate phosphatase